MPFDPNSLGAEGYPPEREPLVETKTGKMTRPWFLFTQTVNQYISLLQQITYLGGNSITPGVGGGGADAPGAFEPDFPPDFDWFGARSHAANAAAPVGVGEPDPAYSGSNTVTNVPLDGIYNGRTTANGPGAYAGVSSAGANQLRPEQDPTWTMFLRTGASVASIRVWILFTDTALADTDTQAGTYFGWRFSTVAGDPGWVGVTRDGVTQAVSGLVGTIAANTTYKLRIRKSGATFYFSVNDSVEVAHTANPPTATATLFWDAKWGTQEFATKTIFWSRHWVRFAGRSAVGTETITIVPPPPLPPPPLPVETITNPPRAAWRVFKTLPQTLSSGVAAALIWESVLVDTEGSINSAKDAFTVKKSGRYLLNCHVRSNPVWRSSGGDSENTSVWITVNGTTVVKAREMVTWVGDFGGGESVQAWAQELGADGIIISASSATGFEAAQIA